MRPIQQIPCGIGAESLTAGLDPHAPEVQPIRIPTSLQGGIPDNKPISMEFARLKEQIETGIIQVHQFSAQRLCEERAAQTMPIVDTLVHPARIMEQRKQATTSISAPFDSAIVNPFSNTRAQW